MYVSRYRERVTQSYECACQTKLDCCRERRLVMPMTWTRTVLIMALLGFAIVPTLGQSDAATSNVTATAHADQTQDQTDQPAQAGKNPEAKADGDYVGSDTCVTCHEDQSRRFNRTAMGKAMAHPHTADEARGCESCHGPGRAHVEAGGGK